MYLLTMANDAVMANFPSSASTVCNHVYSVRWDFIQLISDFTKTGNLTKSHLCCLISSCLCQEKCQASKTHKWGERKAPTQSTLERILEDMRPELLTSKMQRWRQCKPGSPRRHWPSCSCASCRGSVYLQDKHCVIHGSEDIFSCQGWTWGRSRQGCWWTTGKTWKWD